MSEENYSVLVEILVNAESKERALSKVRSILNKAERNKFGFITHYAELDTSKKIKEEK